MLRIFKIIFIFFPTVVLCQTKTFDIIKDDITLAEQSVPENSRYQTLIHQINIYSDFTFEFRHIPFVGCLTWKDFKGAWTQRGDTIIFTDSYALEELDMKFKYSTLTKNKFYTFSFKLDSSISYSNKPVQISFVYDYDSKIDDKKRMFITDSNGNIRIYFKEVENLNKLSAFRIETLLKNGERKWNYFTTSDIANVKKQELPNVVTVNIISKPYKESIERETIAVLSDDLLHIISSKSKKSELSNYSNKLYFSGKYKKVYY